MAEHRGQFSVRAMCRCLRIQPGGFYAWLKSPLSKRALEDQRQTRMLKKAWAESGKVYGYRKLHDDLLDQGESVCPNRVARLTRLKAQIGYKRRPGKYGSKAAVVVDNTLDRHSDVEAPDKVSDDLVRQWLKNNGRVTSPTSARRASLSWPWLSFAPTISTNR